ncbi:MAG: NAD(P)H-hydrate epimerase [Andreesenia angusta]|nr:NAD(P)H-hydrate epimerase [Andreesenia angusta]
MKYLTAEKMRATDRYAIENLKIPGIVLMENAVIKFMNNLDLNKKNYLVVAGGGNNGGDGFGIARHLNVLGKNVKIAILSNPSNIKGDAKINFDILKKLNIDIIEINDMNWHELESLSEDSDIIIDAILGTGLDIDITGHYKYSIAILNSANKPIYSVDLPSGLNADSGKIMGIAIEAYKTITFQYMKKGFLNEDSKRYTGEIILENISIPDWVNEKI